MDDLDVLVDQVLRKHGFEFNLKPQQMEIVANLMRGEHTFGILGTGFGKSMPYMLLPLLLDEVDPEHSPHISLIVSPLRSLIFDQVARAKARNIQCVGITKASEMSKEDQKSLQEGTMSLVFASPEALVAGPWLQNFRKYSSRFCLVTLDELHCLSLWGGDFRDDYLRMAELRSKFSKVPILGLTATMSAKVLRDVLSILHFKQEDVKIVSQLPDRPNIFLDVRHQSRYNIERDLEWVVSGLQSQRHKYPKTIIFCNTVMQTYDVYAFIKTELGSAVYVGEKSHQTRLVSMYHGEISEALQEFTLSTFVKEGSIMRVLVSTIAFGMGVEVPNITQIIHWGRVTSVIGFWQEVGRAGRDGSKATSVWYPQSVGGEEEEKKVLETIKKNRELCVRHTLLAHFQLPGMREPVPRQKSSCTKKCTSCMCQLCSCCTHCRGLCSCRK